VKPKLTINIAEEFNIEPAGRFPTDGPFSGERFREEFLAKAFSEYEIVEVVLDGAEGYGSSFLDEAFGGLVRLKGMSAEELHARLKVISDEDESLEVEVWDYIDTSKPEKA
jgi:hypothetical protein